MMQQAILYLTVFLVSFGVSVSFLIDSQSPMARRNSIKQKETGIDILRRLLQRNDDDDDAEKRKTSRSIQSVNRFDDEDPLHVILSSSAYKPVHRVKTKGLRELSAEDGETNVIKRTADDDDDHRQVGRFLTAIGAESHPSHGSSSSSDSLFDRPYGGGGSDSYDSDSDNGDPEPVHYQYWVDCDEHDLECQYKQAAALAN